MAWFKRRKARSPGGTTPPMPEGDRQPAAFLRLDTVIREGIPASLWRGESPPRASDVPQPEAMEEIAPPQPQRVAVPAAPPPDLHAELEKRLEELLPGLCEELADKIEADLRPKIQAAVHEELGQALQILLHVSEERIRDHALAAVRTELAAEIRACLDTALSNMLKPQNPSGA